LLQVYINCSHDLGDLSSHKLVINIKSPTVEVGQNYPQLKFLEQADFPGAGDRFVAAVDI
jgi:hypothetical protein